MALAVMTEALKESVVLLRLPESDWILVSRGFDLEPSHGAPGRNKDAHRPGSPYQKSWATRKLPRRQFQPTRVPKGSRKSAVLLRLGMPSSADRAFIGGKKVHFQVHSSSDRTLPCNPPPHPGDIQRPALLPAFAVQKSLVADRFGENHSLPLRHSP